MNKTPPPYIPGLNYCHLFPKTTPLKGKQTSEQRYAEYLANFVPYVPSPGVAKFADGFAKVCVGSLFLVVILAVVVLIATGH